MAARSRLSSAPSEDWNCLAVPWKEPCTSAGMWIAAWAAAMSAWASDSEAPSARLNEMVVAGAASWWLTEVGVAPAAHLPIADRGTGCLAVSATAAPCDAPRPGGAWASLEAAPVLVLVCTPPVAVLGLSAAAAAAWAKTEEEADGTRQGTKMYCR